MKPNLRLMILAVLLLLFIMPAGAQQVSNAEYFIDTDPGTGNATAIEGISPGELVNKAFQISTAGLDQGFHKLGVRSRNPQGGWSLNLVVPFYIFNISEATPGEQYDLQAAEYFIDSDPGVGSAVALSLTQQGNQTSLVFPVATEGLSLGFHKLSIRTQNTAGEWSLHLSVPFYIFDISPITPDQIYDLQAAEYFIDNDPGAGSAVALSLTQQGNQTSLVFPVATEGLSLGFHKLSIRTQNTEGEWSLHLSVPFYIFDISPITPDQISDLDAAEYFIDSDPGVGNGVSIAVPGASDNLNTAFQIPVNALAAGPHKLLIRTRDASGKWSVSLNSPFYILPSSDIVLQPLSAAEWFVNEDPGVGNGFPLNLTESFLIEDNLFIDLGPLGLAEANHILYVRVRDAAGVWSLHLTRPFTICNPLSTPAFTFEVACAGLPTIFTNTSTNVPEGSTYAWDFDGNGTADATGEGPHEFTYTLPGIFAAKLTITEPDCGTSFTAQVVVPGISAPAITIAGNATGVCSGQTIALTAPAAASYLWSTGATTQSINVGPGSYFVTITNAQGCTAQSATVVLQPFPVDDCGVCYSAGEDDPEFNTTCLDCAGVINGTAQLDGCGICAGGNTGLTPNESCLDCAGVPNGGAAVDLCGVCSGGNTGLGVNASCSDCNGVPNGNVLPGTPCVSNGIPGTINEACACITPLPDLAVTNIESNATAYSPGEVATVNWTIENIGDASAPISWTERIFIENTDGQNRLLLKQTSYSEAGSIAASGNLNRSDLVTMPAILTIGDQGRFVVQIIPAPVITEQAGGASNNLALQQGSWTVNKVLALSSPAQLTEGGSMNVTVTRSGSAISAQVVSLSITEAARFTIPATVTILAGQASRIFSLTALDNELVEGPIGATLTATADGFAPANRTITLLDNDQPSLSITNLPPTANEGEGLTFQVNTNLAPAQNLTVFISSTNQQRFPVPASVIIPAGQLTANIIVNVPSNTVPQLDAEVVITAGSAGNNSAVAAITVLDDDIPGLELILQTDTVSESSGFFATTGILRRLPDGNPTAFTASLTASLPNTLILPTSLSLAANETQKSFNIGVVDNGDVDGFRTVIITAALNIPGCGCDAPPASAGFVEAPIVVADNDGPALTLTVTPLTLPEGLANAGLLRVSRNTTAEEALSVSLTSSNTNEATVPAVLIIPQGALFAEAAVATIDDGISDGNQQVYFQASASGFAPGIAWAIVSDQNKPDLQVAATQLTNTTIPALGIFDYKVFVANTGFANAPSGILMRGYLSANNVIDANDILITEDIIETSIAVGQTLEVINAVSMPNLPGNWKLIWQVNQNNFIQELLFTNNTSVPVNITVTPTFSATASVANDYYFRGSTIPVAGTATLPNNAPAAGVDVEVYIISSLGLRREILVTTDSQGNFSANFIPLANEAGSYTVGASFPGLGANLAQDAFDILGIRFNSGQFPLLLVTQGTPLTGLFMVQNMSSVALPEFTLQPVTTDAGVTIVFDTIPLLAGNGMASIGYTATGNDVTEATVYQLMTYQVQSTLGTIQNQDFGYYCQAPGGYIFSSISTINTSVSVLSGQTLVSFNIVNSGSGSTGALSVNLPQVDWLSTVTPSTMPPLSPGDTAQVILKFLSSNSLPLNAPVNGTITITGQNSNGLTIPFNFQRVSEVSGSLTVDVSNQFTYYSEGNPKVEGALVRVRNYYTGAVYGQGTTGPDGTLNLSGIPEGTHRITVEKEQHLPYDGTVTISPGLNNNAFIFINYQAVTFSWSVVPTGIEDQYDIQLITQFETNVPVPVVTLDLPESMPQLFGDEVFTFNVVLTNHGLITARDVSLNLPQNDPEYEFITSYEIADLSALNSISVPVLMRRRLEPLNAGLAGNPNFDQISLFMGISSPENISQYSGGGSCVGFANTTYWYYCSLSSGQWEKGGKLFSYSGRSCSSEGPPPSPGGGFSFSSESGGQFFWEPIPLPECIGICVTNPVIGFIAPLAGTAEKKDCVECLLDLAGALAGCSPHPLVSGAGGAAIQALQAGYCLSKTSLNSPDAVGCIPAPDIIDTPCGLSLAQAAAGCATSFESDVAQPTLQNGFGAVGAAYFQVLQDFEQSLIAFELRELWSVEYFGNIVFKDSWFELALLIQPYFVDFEPVSDVQRDAIILSMQGFDITADEISTMISRWNLSLEAWNQDILEPTTEYPNIINWAVVISYITTINEVADYAELRGFSDAFEMYVESYNFFNDVVGNANGTVCAAVTIQISQQLTMTREAFEGTLNIFNGHPTDQLDSLTVNIEIKNPQGVVSNGLFQIETLQLNNLNNVSGTGSLNAQEDGSVKFLFIPEIEAAPEAPVFYSFGGSITYYDPFAQAMTTLPLNPVSLTVNPSPNLYLHYFLERNILSDDPLTQDVVEPTIPAELAVMVENSGNGPAVNMTLSSAQPQIIDNETGLAISFQLVGSALQGQPANLGVTNINLGTIPPVSTKIGQWFLTSSLLGKFVNYNAQVVHSNSFGNPDLSLVQGATLHELTRSIRVYGEQEDGLNDFLVNDLFDAQDRPDVIYLSQGFETLPVIQAISGSFNNPVQAPTFTNTLTVTPLEEGWNFIKLDDPGNGLFDIASVTRSDGQLLPLQNTWLTFVTLPASQEPVYENKFHVVDNIPTNAPTSYTVVWTPKNFDVPEVVSISGAPEGVSGEQVTNLSVTFSKPIDPATFGFEDLTLVYQGIPVTLNSNVVITQLTPESFDVNIAPFTLGNGFYIFTAQAAGVTDIFGISGTAGKQVSWTQFVDVPAVLAFQSLPANNTGNAFNRVDVLFNLPVNPATVIPERFSILLDGVLQPGTLTIDSVRADLRLYYLGGLGSILTTDGAYEFVVDMPNIETPTGIPGEQVQSTNLTRDTQGPTVVNLTANNQTGLDVQHYNFADIQFNEPALGFTIGDVVLSRNGEQIFLNIAQLQNISQAFWRGGNFQMLTYPDGDYTFTINLAGVTDALGNPGAGTAQVSWTVDRSVTIEVTNLAISPDLGLSSSDGITSQSNFNVHFNLNQNTSLVTVSMVDLGVEYPLASLNNLSAGPNSVPVNFTVTGNVGLKVTAFGSAGGTASASKQLFIDQSPLNAAWLHNNGVQLAAQLTELFIDFSAPILSNTPIPGALQLSRNGQIVPGALSFTQNDAIGYTITGIDALSNLPGNYQLSINLAQLNKASSGIAGNSLQTATWTVQSNNLAPIANAGPDQTITIVGVYSLDGTVSTDPNGDAITYNWVAPAGITLSDNASPTPSFAVNAANNGAYTILLIASDGALFSTDQVVVTVNISAGTTDCAGVVGGTAFIDNCGICAGGNTGITPCVADCNGDFGGTAILDNCGICAGGNTGITPCVADCNGEFGGTAILDNCGTCTGGNTGITPCVADCNGEFGGTAILDNCGTCTGGNTGITPCVADCNGDFGGAAILDNCGICAGGNTGITPCVADCNGDFGGSAALDNCGICTGGNTGLEACLADCNGVFGGTAFFDNCGSCVGGATGAEPCTEDCNGIFGGSATLDNCGICAGGNTGITPCVADCNGDFGGTATLDNCGICAGGNTGITPCVADCNGDFGGAAIPDNCGICAGGNTGLEACLADCNGVFGGTAFFDNCGSCVGGATGAEPCTEDCNGIFGGSAFTDNCGICVGGNTGLDACIADCNGDFGGTAILDNCGICAGGNTGITPCVADCNGDFGGTAILDNCGICAGGNTGITPCVADCNGDFGGTAILDNCGICAGGNTGITPCVADCNGDFGGTAILDNCGICAGGNTGLDACIADCNGDFGGTAILDNCGTCVGGNTGITPCVADCNGDFGGTAILDNCGICAGGNTGLEACVQDCNGDFGGTAFFDLCGQCVGGNTGTEACVADCNGDLNGTAYTDDCGQCVEGNTNLLPCNTDCFGISGGLAITDDCGVCRLPDDPEFNSSCADCIGIPNGNFLPGTTCFTNGLEGTYNDDCICIANPVQEPCRYFMSNYNAQGGSDIYEFLIDETNKKANLTLVHTTPHKVSIAVNELTGRLIMIRESGNGWQFLNLLANPISATQPVTRPNSIGLVTGAVYSDNGLLYVATQQPKAIWTVSFNPVAVSNFSNAQVTGGDIAFNLQGDLNLISTAPQRVIKVNPNGPNTILGPAPANTSGVARKGGNSFLVSAQGSADLILGDSNGSDLGVRYQLLLNGTPFVPNDGDLASGCISEQAALVAADDEIGLSEENTLLYSLPNPTEGISTVVYQPATSGSALLEVYDIRGVRLATIFNLAVEAGQVYSSQFDGSALPNGVYLYRLTTESEVKVEKFMIAR